MLSQRLQRRIAMLAGVGVMATSTAIALSIDHRPACAQGSTYPECVAELINLGVSPDVAAQECRGTQPSGLDACINRAMFVTAQAASGPTEDGAWRYPLYGPVDGSAMRQVGCRQRSVFEVSGWRCSSETMEFQVLSAPDAAAQCRGDRPTSPPSSTTILQRQGTLSSNNTSQDFVFQGNANQTIRIRVLGEGGFDPVVRLEDFSGRVLAENDDAGGGSFDSLLVHTLPRNESYRAVVRGFGNRSGQFTILIDTQ